MLKAVEEPVKFDLEESLALLLTWLTNMRLTPGHWGWRTTSDFRWCVNGLLGTLYLVGVLVSICESSPVGKLNILTARES